jgi:hypothetical protein
MRPDLENIDHVANVPAKQPKPAILIVAPADRTRYPNRSAKRQNLDVEHIAVDALCFEQMQRDLAPDFETALRIVYFGQAHHGMHEHRETFGAYAAVPRLPGARYLIAPQHANR